MTATASRPRRFDRDVDGILLLDKPVGLSSNAALQQARGFYRALKAGHAGSLDPLASGMLPVCFGQATKVCAFLLDARKTYRFTARLGERTDTGDAEGAIVERQAVPPLPPELVLRTLQSCLGEQQQVPPMYSALKHDGERLYELARRGETVERPSRTVIIESLDLVRIGANELEITVRCSKGTYVRTLAEDIAHRMGTVAHLIALRRLQVDPFADRRMYSLESLQSIQTLEELDSLLTPPDQALLQLSDVEVNERDEQALLRGQAIRIETRLETESHVRMYGPERRFLGIGEIDAQGAIQPRRLLVKSTINP
jgi:tRNA pseudouridine55 synthase